MKIMIDIPYGHYCTIKDGFLSECLQATTEAILNGTPIPDNATNGDVIKALFPRIKLKKFPTFLRVIDGEEYIPMTFDWWNAPYKRGDTDE